VGTFFSPSVAKWPPKAGRSSTMAACCRQGMAVEEITDVIATRPLRKKKKQQPCVSTGLGTNVRAERKVNIHEAHGTGSDQDD
jgi:hypothetical protein